MYSTSLALTVTLISMPNYYPVSTSLVNLYSAKKYLWQFKCLRLPFIKAIWSDSSWIKNFSLVYNTVTWTKLPSPLRRTSFTFLSPLSEVCSGLLQMFPFSRRLRKDITLTYGWFTKRAVEVNPAFCFAYLSTRNCPLCSTKQNKNGHKINRHRPSLFGQDGFVLHCVLIDLDGKLKNLVICSIVIYLDCHSTKRALWLVDSWSRALDQI